MTHVLNSFLDGLPLDMLFPTPKDLPSLARDKPLFSPVIQLLAQPVALKNNVKYHPVSYAKHARYPEEMCKGDFCLPSFLVGYRLL